MFAMTADTDGPELIGFPLLLAKDEFDVEDFLAFFVDDLYLLNSILSSSSSSKSTGYALSKSSSSGSEKENA